MPQVFIASMNMRGKWAECPKHYKKVNVTSAQQTSCKYRIDFSPMSAYHNGYKEFYCFENYWQAGKCYQDIDRDKQLEWWKKQKKGYRRYPNSKGKKVLYAKFPGLPPLYYIDSRKQVYVPEYYNIIKDCYSLKELKTRQEKGEIIVIYDFDGPRNDDGTPTMEEVTLELLKEKINGSKHPFGHGYIIAAELAGIAIEDYIV